MRIVLILLLITAAWAGDKEKAAIDAEVAKAEAAVLAALAKIDKLKAAAAAKGDIETVQAAVDAAKKIKGDHNSDGHADNGKGPQKDPPAADACGCANCTCGTVAEQPPVVVPPAGPAQVGRWKMDDHGGHTYTFFADGTATCASLGTWVEQDGKMIATWDNGFVDSFGLPCVNDCLEGVNNQNAPIKMVRCRD